MVFGGTATARIHGGRSRFPRHHTSFAGGYYGLLNASTSPSTLKVPRLQWPIVHLHLRRSHHLWRGKPPTSPAFARRATSVAGGHLLVMHLSSRHLLHLMCGSHLLMMHGRPLLLMHIMRRRLLTPSTLLQEGLRLLSL